MSEEQNPIELVPEKFRSETLEESLSKWAQSTSELEKKLGERSELPNYDSREAALKAVGVSMADLEGEWLANDGKLSDDTYAKFQKAGVSRFAIDSIGEAEALRGSLLRESVIARAGGEQQFETLKEWAQSNADPKALDAYDAAIQSRDITKASEAMAAIADAYQTANGTKGSKDIIGGGNVPRVTASPFANYHEFAEASRDQLRGGMSMDEFNRRVEATRKSNPSALREPPRNSY